MQLADSAQLVLPIFQTDQNYMESVFFSYQSIQSEFNLRRFWFEPGVKSKTYKLSESSPMRIHNWVSLLFAFIPGGALWAAQTDGNDYAWRANGASYQLADEPYYTPQPTIQSRQMQGSFSTNPVSSNGLLQRRSQNPGFDEIGSGNLADLPAAPANTRSAVTSQPGLTVQDMGDPLPEQCKPSWCNLGPEWTLFPTTPNGLAFGGWSQIGYHSRATDSFNDRPGRFNLHQQWFYLERQTDASRNWGFRADLIYGIDGQNIQAFGNPPTGAPTGWDNGWDFGSYGWALPQAYVNYENDLWNIKMGRFFSPFGFEQIASPQNFFYSRSFARTFIEPFGLTGVLAERRISAKQSVLVGLTTGWDTGFEQNSSGITAITGTRTEITDNIFLSTTGSWGNTGIRGDGFLASNVLEVGLSDRTFYVLQGDILNLDDVNEFSIVQYLFHSFNPCLQVGSRLEWWKSNQFFPSTQSTWSYTSGINFRRTANFMIRPETRYDWGAGAVNPARLAFGVDGILTF